MAIKEEDGAEGLILGGGRDVAFGGEVGEELPDLGGAHFFGVAFVVKEDVVFDPLCVGLFGAGGIALEAQGFAVLVE